MGYSERKSRLASARFLDSIRDVMADATKVCADRDEALAREIHHDAERDALKDKVHLFGKALGCIVAATIRDGEGEEREVPGLDEVDISTEEIAEAIIAESENMDPEDG